MINTYYTALGIHETATQDEIKGAYRKKALSLHPDKNNGSLESKQAFIHIHLAYTVLSNSEKRLSYDKKLALAKDKYCVVPEIKTQKEDRIIVRFIKTILRCAFSFAILFLIYYIPSTCGGRSDNNSAKESVDGVVHRIEYIKTSLSTGETPYSNKFGQGKYDKNSLSYIEIANGAKSDAVAMLYDVNRNMVYRHIYITANDKYTMKNIPEGLYDLKVYYGNNWNPDKVNGEGFPTGGFLANESFSHSETQDYFDIEFVSTSDGVSYPTITVTLYEVSNGNMETEKISKNDFFN